MSDPRADTILSQEEVGRALTTFAQAMVRGDQAQATASRSALLLHNKALVDDLEAARAELIEANDQGADLIAERDVAVERARKAAERASVILRDASVRLRTATGEGYTFEQGRSEVARELADALAEETQ